MPLSLGRLFRNNCLLSTQQIRHLPFFFLQPETDNSSSLCDAPILPHGEAKVRFLDDGTEAEENGDGSSRLSCPELCSFILVAQNPSPREDDTLTNAFEFLPAQAGPSASNLSDSGLKKLSGRSSAILKQFFDENASTVSLPLGHRVVAFTEPQVYHLLRVLTEETLKMSYTAMEQMVIGAVKGAPITSESSIDHFRIRTRAQTPRP